MRYKAHWFWGITFLWGVFVLIGLWGVGGYWACLVQSLAIPLGVLSTLFLLWAMLLKKITFTILFSTICFSVFYLVLGSITSESVCKSAAIQILQANVYQFNSDKQKCIDELREKKADILVLHEISQNWIQFLERLGYRYKMLETVPDSLCCYGMAVLSNLPILDTMRRYSENIAVLSMRINDLHIVTTHWRNPAVVHKYLSSLNQIEDLTELVNSLPKHRIVVGDLNCVPWDQRMKQFLNKTGLRDSRDQILPTFRRNFPVLPIDYILIDSTLNFFKTETFFISGSDHYGLRSWICRK